MAYQRRENFLKPNDNDGDYLKLNKRNPQVEETHMVKSFKKSMTQSPKLMISIKQILGYTNEDGYMLEDSQDKDAYTKKSEIKKIFQEIEANPQHPKTDIKII